jgi:hypothetical protein
MAKDTTKYSNNARAVLMQPILATDQVLQVNSVAAFPTLSSTTESFMVTLDDGSFTEIVKVQGILGSTFINCLRGQEGTTARAFAVTTKVENRLTAGNITAFARLTDRVADVTSLEDLVAPASTNANSILCASVDAGGLPIFVLKSGTLWRSLNYSQLLLTGAAGVGGSTTSISLASASTLLPLSAAKAYVIQFTSGTELGKLRFLTVGASSVSWATALASAPLSTDTFEIYQCSNLAMMPTGAGPDKVFFENSQIVTRSYSLTPGKNAVSAGPILIQPGVTVTVPTGAGWSVV